MIVKKGQLSIEAMIIYGLVILVAFSVIGTLLYFNVLDLGSYLPDKCDLGGTSDLKCEEMAYTTGDDIELGIRNIGPKAIEGLVIKATDTSKVHFSGVEVSTPIAVAIAPGDLIKVTIDTATSGSAKPGKVLRATLGVTYKYSDGVVSQSYAGSLRVEAAK